MQTHSRFEQKLPFFPTVLAQKRKNTPNNTPLYALQKAREKTHTSAKIIKCLTHADTFSLENNVFNVLYPQKIDLNLP